MAKKRPVKAYKNLKFLNSREARPIRILAEFSEPYHRFRQYEIDSTIVFFGSARMKPKAQAKKHLKTLVEKYQNDFSQSARNELAAARLQVRLSKYYEDAKELSTLITKWSMNEQNEDQQYYVCSGGGPGIMEAANKGAKQAGGKSIGLNISIPHEQAPNPYITEEFSFEFHYFFMRKYWFVYMAKALVIFPGGFGTLDELMEVLTLLQTKKINRKLPIIVFGQDYWQEVIDINAMVKWGTIAKEDLQLMRFVNSPQEAFAYLQENLSVDK
ncbi:MAG: TIGR00730 family Rossman fold protein [Caldithrix sp.]|nr:TIGR00730 family Rossman fold protein [Caldithrix sp.]